MLRRNRKPELPLSRHSSINGSGNSISFESPVVRKIKNISWAVKISYFCLFSSILTIFYGFKNIFSNTEYTHLVCQFSGCSLDVKEPGKKKIHTKIHRQQIIRSDYVKVNSKTGLIAESIQGKAPVVETVYDKKKKKKNTDLFDSYTLVFKAYNRTEMGDFIFKDEMYLLDELPPAQERINLHPSDSEEQFIFLMRPFEVHARAYIKYNRLKSYIQGKRNKLTLRESRSPTILGVMMIVFGILFMIISMILGVFWESSPKRRRMKK